MDIKYKQLILQAFSAVSTRTRSSVTVGTFLHELRDHVPGVDIDGDQRPQSDPCLFGQFPSHQLHDVSQLVLQLLMVVS